MKKLLSTLLVALLTPMSSFALFEARVTYGPYLTSGDPAGELCSGNALCSGTLPSKLPLPFMGVDALVKLPLIPFGFGLRYEKLTASGSSSNMEASASFNRTAVLVNYRLIDTILHVGPIFSYGISHSGGIEMKQNGTKILDYTASAGESYSVGLEVGIKPLIIIPLKIGAEAGISQFKFKDAKDSLGSAPKDINLSGNYLKVFLGLDL
jgi:hypothetical protein